MKYEGCEFCCCYDCSENCKNCDSCNEGIDGFGYCKIYKELEKKKMDHGEKI